MNKYLDLTSELNKLRNTTVTVIPVVIRALGMVPKRLEKGTSSTVLCSYRDG